MEEEQVNIEGPLFEQLQTDRRRAEFEIAQAEDGLKLLRFKLHYIETLIASARSHQSFGPVILQAGSGVQRSGLYHGLTIAEVAVRILSEEGKPMSAMDIARRAMDRGFDAEHVERARSHISAVISKDMKSPNPRFRQVDRGSIGLVEWNDNPAAGRYLENGARIVKSLRERLDIED